MTERVRALELMEMQRHAQLMYTSCGWFFDDISGIETVQIIAYAARVLQLAQRLFGAEAAGLEPAFLAAWPRRAPMSPSAGDGARIYKEKVGTMELGLEQVAAHYAISSIFSSFAEETELFCYRVRRISYDIYTSGRGRLALGRVHIASAITGQQQSFSFAVLHFGDQNITAAVKAYDDDDAESFETFAAAGRGAGAARRFPRGDSPARPLLRPRGLLAHLAVHATSSGASCSSSSTPRSGTSRARSPPSTKITPACCTYLSQAGLPKPPALTLAAGFAINAGLRRALEGDPIDQALLRSFLSLAKADQVPLETATLSYIADQRMKRAMIELQMSSGSLEMLDRALDAGPHPGGAALRSEPVAGAEHLVRDPAHLELCAHRAGARRPAAWDKAFSELGSLPVDRPEGHQRPGSGAP